MLSKKKKVWRFFLIFLFLGHVSFLCRFVFYYEYELQGVDKITANENIVCKISLKRKAYFKVYFPRDYESKDVRVICVIRDCRGEIVRKIYSQYSGFAVDKWMQPGEYTFEFSLSEADLNELKLRKGKIVIGVRRLDMLPDGVYGIHRLADLSLFKIWTFPLNVERKQRDVNFKKNNDF